MSLRVRNQHALFILGAIGLFGGSVGAQTPAFVCNATGGNPTIVRQEGLAERVGDLVLNCTGGTPTAAGQPIPEYTVQLTFNTNVTNRLFPQVAQEPDALLAIDEPFPANPVPSNVYSVFGIPQILCTATGGSCAEIGTGGTPNPYLTQPNIFFAQQTGANQLTWTVPIDPPGPSGVRIIRITNVRANVFMLGPPVLFTPTVDEVVNVQGTPQIMMNNPLQTVGVASRGLFATFNFGSGLLQCVPHNASLLGGSGVAAFDFNVQVQEGYGGAFKFRNYGTVLYGQKFPQQLSDQNVFGFSYNTESGIYSASLFTSVPTVGLADFGTRIRIVFQNVVAGSHVFVPTNVGAQAVNCSPAPQCSTGGQLQLVRAGKYGSSAPGYEPVPSSATINGTAVAEVNYSGTTAYATYEVINSDPNVTEIVTIPVAVAFTSSNVPAVSLAEVNTSFAPLNTTAVSDPTAPLPRFSNTSRAGAAYSINSCPATPLTGTIQSKSGALNARVWNVQVDSGASPAFGASIDAFTLTQSAGTTCHPAVTNPASFPLSLDYIPKNSFAIAPITIDFTGCDSTTRFDVQIPLSANNGVSTGMITRTNAYR